MTKALRKSDFVGSPFKLVAVPAAGDTATYARLTDIELAAYALWRTILTYRAIPAHPGVAEYRERAMAMVEENIADMRKALSDG